MISFVDICRNNITVPRRGTSNGGEAAERKTKHVIVSTAGQPRAFFTVSRSGTRTAVREVKNAP